MELGDTLLKSLVLPGGFTRRPTDILAYASGKLGNYIHNNYFKKDESNNTNTAVTNTPVKSQVETFNKRYPGFNESDYNRLVEIADSTGKTGTQKDQLMDELYQYYYPQVLNHHKLDERQEVINNWVYSNGENLANGDRETNLKYRFISLSQMAKQKFDIAYNANDAEVVNALTNDIENGKELLRKYLNNGDTEILYAAGIYDKGEEAPDFRSQKDIAKEALGENYWKNVWDKMYTNSFAPLDSWEKKLYTLKKNMKNHVLDAYAGLVGQAPKAVQDYILGDMTYEEFMKNRMAMKEKDQKKIDNYINLVNETTNAEREKRLNPEMDNYYNRRNFTDLLADGDIGGFFYKAMGDSASNWDMPVIIGASVVNPAAGAALMGTNSYVRESQEAYETMRNAGATHEQAEIGGSVVGLVNTAIEIYLDKALGGVESTSSKGFREALKKNVMEEVQKKPFEEIVASASKKYVQSSLEEGLEEWLQNLVTNAAEMTVKENPEWKDLFEGGRASFEGGVFNPMNLVSGVSDIAQNKESIKQSMLDGATEAGYMARNITDTLGITKDGTTNTEGNVNTQGGTAVEGTEMVTPQGTVNTEGTEITTPQGAETTVDNTVTETNNKGDKSTLKEELYSIDPTLKKNLQNNPYTAEVWQRTQDYIDKNGRPERSNDVAKALIVEVADKVQEKLVEKMKEGGKNGRLYQTIDDAGFTVDLTELKDGLDEILEGYGIKIEDGKLNFDKTAIDGSEANNIRKIYNWLKDTNAPMSEKEFRTRFKQAMKDMVDFNPVGRDKTGRKKADTPGDKVIKGIMKKANDLAHAQIPELAELDKIYSEWTDIMDEVSDGLVYKDAVKRGVIKDNVYQIIKNLDEPSRRQMVNRLEKLIPGIKDEVNAINQMPKVIDHIYNPSKLQQGLTSEGVKTVGAIGGLPGYLLAKWGGEGIAKLIDSQKNKAWNEVLQETSEEGKAKMREIQAKIEENKRLSQEQEARLQGLKDRLLEKMATVEKTDAEQSAWESYLADLEQDEVIDMPEEVYDQWEEVTTTPKKKTTKKKISKRSTKLDTKKIASDYIKGEMDWNKYQHLAGLTEEQALEKRGKFQAAIDEEWDKNQDYYNTHQSELVEKFHHLLK